MCKVIQIGVIQIAPILIAQQPFDLIHHEVIDIDIDYKPPEFVWRVHNIFILFKCFKRIIFLDIKQVLLSCVHLENLLI